MVEPHFEGATLRGRYAFHLGEPPSNEWDGYEYTLCFNSARVTGELGIYGISNTIDKLSLAHASVHGDLVLVDMKGSPDTSGRWHVDCRGLRVTGGIYARYLEQLVFLVNDETIARRIHWAAPGCSVVYLPPGEE